MSSFSCHILLFAILQKYDFSSKSQPALTGSDFDIGCLRYCKSTIFQANHNTCRNGICLPRVVCDTAKVRFFKQITTLTTMIVLKFGCLRYCKSTIFQANHNATQRAELLLPVVCDTAKVRFFKQITTQYLNMCIYLMLFAILQKYDFSSKSQHLGSRNPVIGSCLRYCKSTIFQANHNRKCGG